MQTGTTLISEQLPAVRGSDFDPNTRKALAPPPQSTANTVGPKTVRLFDTNNQFAFFGRFLRNSQLATALNEQYFPTAVEQSHDLDVEGDVERAGSLYLLHNVILVFEKFLETRQLGERLTVANQETVGRGRPDVKFKVNDQVILIWDWKKTQTIFREDWESGVVNNADDAQRVVDGLQADGVRSALSSDAYVISQQATKYARENCKLFIACNYQKMVVLDFQYNPQPIGARWDNVHNPVRMLFCDDNQAEITHRQLLLAALLYGMHKVGLINLDE